jgi:hypothetical protein
VGSATAAQLVQPNGLASGANGDLWIADKRNQRIRNVSNGVITAVAGTGVQGMQRRRRSGYRGETELTTGVAADARPSVYRRSGNDRVRVLLPSGTCTVLVNWNTLQADASGRNLTGKIAIVVSCPWSVTGLPDSITVDGEGLGHRAVYGCAGGRG